MPNWNNLHDIYNNTCDNFNPYGVKLITEAHITKYFPYGEICQLCMFDYEVPKKECFNDSSICKCRIKDKSVGKTFVLCRSLGREKDYDSFNMRTGNVTWLYHNKVGLILRACNENGLELHHIMGNPYDNRGHMVALVDKHAELHGVLKSLSTRIGHLIIIGNKSPHYREDLFREIKALQKTFSKIQKGAKSSPRVYQIIDINTQIIRQTMSIEDGQKRLEDIGAAISQNVKENYDLRKMKNDKHRIIKFEEEQLKRNAIQNI